MGNFFTSLFNNSDDGHGRDHLFRQPRGVSEQRPPARQNERADDHPAEAFAPRPSHWNASRPSPAAVKQREINMSNPRHCETQSVPQVETKTPSSSHLGPTFRDRDAGYSAARAWFHDTRSNHRRGKTIHG